MNVRAADLRVGRQSAGFIGRGHPWVRRDRFTRLPPGCVAGDPVTLVAEDGRRLAAALADPDSAVCARIHHRRPDRTFDPAAAIAAAWARRAALHADPDTDCYRVVHGEADGLPGLIVERLADELVVTYRCRAILAWQAAITAALHQVAPGMAQVHRRHIADIRRGGPELWRADGAPLTGERELVGRELGVELLLRPEAGLATGIYVDQRATRAWLRERCGGARVLNLFAYTGLFSVSLLRAGAAAALDVDTARPALELARRNAERNGVASRHRTRRIDCRAFLDCCADQFDIVICDPPTAATGTRGWVAHRDYPHLLRAITARLVPGGMLIACCNTRGGRVFDLARAVRRTPGLQCVPGPELCADLPQLPGFVEGRPYRLVAAVAA